MNQNIGLAMLATTIVLGPARWALSQDVNQALLDDRASERGFRSIFNGKDLTGWEGNPRLWSVKQGAITGQTTKENSAKGNTFLDEWLAS
jgi:hypothetical protein